MSQGPWTKDPGTRSQGPGTQMLPVEVPDSHVKLQAKVSGD